MSTSDIISVVQWIAGILFGLIIFIFFRIVNGLKEGIKTAKKDRKAIKKQMKDNKESVNSSSMIVKGESSKQDAGIKHVESIHEACKKEMGKRVTILDGGIDPSKGTVAKVYGMVENKVDKEDYEKEVASFREELKSVSGKIEGMTNAIHTVEISMTEKFVTKSELKDSQDRIFDTIQGVDIKIDGIYKFIVDAVRKETKDVSYTQVLPPTVQ